MPLRRAYSRSASASIGRSSRRETTTTSRFMSRPVSHRQLAGSTSTRGSSTPRRWHECAVSIVPFSLNSMIVLRSTFSARHVCSSAWTSAGVSCSSSSDANRVDRLVNRRSNPNRRRRTSARGESATSCIGTTVPLGARPGRPARVPRRPTPWARSPGRRQPFPVASAAGRRELSRTHPSRRVPAQNFPRRLDAIEDRHRDIGDDRVGGHAS